jgi:hypothetical protein
MTLRLLGITDAAVVVLKHHFGKEDDGQSLFTDRPRRFPNGLFIFF